MSTNDKLNCIWHPFTQMQTWDPENALVIEKGEGNYLIDVQGNRYLDGVSSLWVNVHGHGHKAINRAIQIQLDRVAHSTLLGLTNEPAMELAHQLVQITPKSLKKVFYSDSGSSAVEIALKQAFQYWQLRGNPKKRNFAHLTHAYHGDTLGAVSVGGIELFHNIFGPLLFDTYPLPSPTPRYYPEGTPLETILTTTVDAVAKLFEEREQEIAAIIVEPLIQGAAGMLTHVPGYLKQVENLCKEHQVLLIVDEVATGFGRTGTMFAVEQENVEPDLLCLAKGITGGYLPLAATLATDEIYRAFLAPPNQYRAFYHGHTYTGNPLGCAAAIASLEVFRQERTLEQLPTKIDTLAKLLGSQLKTLPNVREIRQKGLMVGVELQERPGVAFAPDAFTGAKVCNAARLEGVILRPLGDVIILMPPLSIQQSELELLVCAIKNSIAKVCQ